MERDRGTVERGVDEPFEGLLGELEDAVTTACETRAEWPDQVSAGICAGVDFAIERPAVIDVLAITDRGRAASEEGFTAMVERLARLISRAAPAGSRLPGSTDEALVAGIISLVGDHIRVGRLEALRELRPDLVLLALLPYLGFEDARRWANRL
jgi:hypothetical protein